MWTLIAMMAAQTGASPMPSFLAGCWEERRTDGGWTEECWTSGRGGVMLGSGRDGKGESVGHWEWMRIERGDDRVLTFHASPQGAPAVTFKASTTGADTVTFVNPANDYPQRVRYTRSAAGLDAEISMMDGSRKHRWRYRRAGTPAAE